MDKRFTFLSKSSSKNIKYLLNRCGCEVSSNDRAALITCFKQFFSDNYETYLPLINELKLKTMSKQELIDDLQIEASTNKLRKLYFDKYLFSYAIFNLAMETRSALENYIESDQLELSTIRSMIAATLDNDLIEEGINLLNAEQLRIVKEAFNIPHELESDLEVNKALVLNDLKIIIAKIREETNLPGNDEDDEENEDYDEEVTLASFQDWMETGKELANEFGSNNFEIKASLVSVNGKVRTSFSVNIED